jgi:chemotaxis protein methyltransferase WspC
MTMTMAMGALTERLAGEIGLAAESLGPDAIARAVARIAARLALGGEALHERLLDRGSEWALLIEELTVQESWFFRDRHSFHALAEFSRDRAGTLRVLSAPCAAGEEPYSIAMCLLEAGRSPEQFAIDAVDISRRAIDLAQAAVYTPNSFRKECGDRQARYFTPKGSDFELSGRIKSCVRFAHANVLSAGFTSQRALYDVIFCRNLLIYLTDSARARLLASVDALLAPDGILFTGPSELPLVLAHGFSRLSGERVFGCRRSPAPAPRAAAPKRAPSPPKRIAAVPRAEIKPAVRPAAASLADARRLADAGDVAAAIKLCDRLLAASPGFAEVYCLLGVIHQSAGNDMLAEQHFQRALYLDPNQYEALIHMSMLAEKRRDADAGRRFRQRAERAMSAGSGGDV